MAREREGAGGREIDRLYTHFSCWMSPAHRRRGRHEDSPQSHDGSQHIGPVPRPVCERPGEQHHGWLRGAHVDEPPPPSPWALATPSSPRRCGFTTRAGSSRAQSRVARVATAWRCTATAAPLLPGAACHAATAWRCGGARRRPSPSSAALRRAPSMGGSLPTRSEKESEKFGVGDCASCQRKVRRTHCLCKGILRLTHLYI